MEDNFKILFDTKRINQKFNARIIHNILLIPINEVTTQNIVSSISRLIQSILLHSALQARYALRGPELKDRPPEGTTGLKGAT